MTTAAQGSWVERIAALQDSEDSTRSCNWEGTFEDYLNLSGRTRRSPAPPSSGSTT